MGEEIKEKIKAHYVANDIDEVLDYITNLQEKLKVSQTNEETYRLEMQDITKILRLDEHTIFDEVKEYATNLQEEVEDLREDNYAYHQLMKMQNKREYRSKFLKEFQEEFGTNTFPDYDEIYKRYDKIKKENERLKQRCEYLERSNNRREDEIMSLRDECVDGETYKSRNEKTTTYYYKTLSEYNNQNKKMPDEAVEMFNLLENNK